MFNTLMPRRRAVVRISVDMNPLDAFSKMACVRLIRLDREPNIELGDVLFYLFFIRLIGFD